MRALGILLLIAGCDRLFALDHLPSHPADAPGGDTLGDGAQPPDDIQTPADATPCSGNGFDEDSDAIDDNCDVCPTYPNAGQDTDHDGLDDACDHDDAPIFGDRILMYATFAQATDLTHFTTGNVTYTTQNKGTVTLKSTSRLTTVDPFLPTRVELVITGITGAGGLTSQLTIGLDNTTVCRVQAADCSGNITTQTCVRLDPSGGASGWPHDATTARLVSLYSSGTLDCSVTAPAVSPATATIASTFPTGQIDIAAPNATVTIESIVIYGSN